jgi:hypothetical protein
LILPLATQDEAVLATEDWTAEISEAALITEVWIAEAWEATEVHAESAAPVGMEAEVADQLLETLLGVTEAQTDAEDWTESEESALLFWCLCPPSFSSGSFSSGSFSSGSFSSGSFSIIQY